MVHDVEKCFHATAQHLGSKKSRSRACAQELRSQQCSAFCAVQEKNSLKIEYGRTQALSPLMM